MSDFKPLPKPMKAQSSQEPSKKRKPEPVSEGKRIKQVKPLVKVVQPVTVKEPARDRQQPFQSQPKVIKKTASKPSSFQRKVNRAYRFVRKNSRRILTLGAALILVVSLISLLGRFVTGENSMAIYLGEEHFGYISYTEELNEAAFRAEVIGRMEARENARLQVDEFITLRPASGSSRDVLPLNEAIEQLAATLSFQIIGTAIEVNGNRMGVLRTESEAEEVIWRLQSPFLQGSADEYYLIEFVEDLRLVSATVPEDALSAVQQLMHQLDVRTVIEDTYIVQAGDNLGGIALRHNITLTQLFNDNPDFNANSILRVGDVLQIQSYRPLLSVRTVKVETRTTSIPIITETLENPGEVNTFSQVIQAGVEGEQETVVHIIRVNGVQTEPEQIMSTRVIREMEEEIVEVGTMDVSIDRR